MPFKPATSAVHSAVLPANQPSEILVDGKKPRPICHMETDTGSLIKRHRVCMTPRDYNDRRDDAQAKLRHMTSGVSSCGRVSCDRP